MRHFQSAVFAAIDMLFSLFFCYCGTLAVNDITSTTFKISAGGVAIWAAMRAAVKGYEQSKKESP